MVRIQRLSTALVNQIAAGEVIERPASVVKELLENAIDAGAAHIRIEIDQGGRKLIRVTDDGVGMSPDDLALAFASHATSKIRSADELDHIATMGFRGEALASIGAIGQARIVSRPRGETAGAEVTCTGGEIGEVTPAGAPEGTIIEVRNLFFNAPVRARFLKKVATEFGHIAEAVQRVALANAGVQFALVHNGKAVFDLAPVDDLRERIAALFGRDLADHLGAVELVDGDVVLEGFAAPPYESRAGTQMQYVYLNGRYIRDRTIMHAIREAYRGHMEVGRSPIVFLFLSLDPRSFDVNVHPMKIEIRLAEPQRVHRAVHSTIRRWLMEADTLKPLDTLAGESRRPTPEPPAPAEPTARAPGEPSVVGHRIERVHEAIADYLSHLPPAGSPQRVNGDQRRAGRAGGGRPLPPTMPRTKISREEQRELAPLFPGEGGSSAPAVADGQVFQLFDTYIVAGSADGLVVIDQHALHERVLQERLDRRLRDAPLEMQRLLVPVTADLSPAEFAWVQSSQEMLARLGIEVEPFGGTTVAIRSFPALLEAADPASLLHDLVAAATAGEAPEQAALLEQLVNVMACRGAIKAGQTLTAEQMRDLVGLVSGLGDRDTCPHGRPTVLRLTRADLEKQFRRT